MKTFLIAVLFALCVQSVSFAGWGFGLNLGPAYVPPPPPPQYYYRQPYYGYNPYYRPYNPYYGYGYGYGYYPGFGVNIGGFHGYHR